MCSGRQLFISRKHIASCFYKPLICWSFFLSPTVKPQVFFKLRAKYIVVFMAIMLYTVYTGIYKKILKHRFEHTGNADNNGPTFPPRLFLMQPLLPEK